jgi:hypothetical protein
MKAQRCPWSFIYLAIFDRIKDNSIPATAFRAISAPLKPGEREENETQKGLRVADRGFLNTAVIQSTITYIDGDAGGSSAHLVMLSYTC